VQAVAEREGTVTSGELRVQRYYPAIGPDANTRPDFAIAGAIGQRLGLKLEDRIPALALLQVAEKVPAYSGLNYQKLAEVSDQWPVFGRKDLYYGGTGYANQQGLGVKISLAADGINPHAAREGVALPPASLNGLVLVPVTRLLDRGSTVVPSELLHSRLTGEVVRLNPRTAEKLGVNPETGVMVTAPNWTIDASLQLDDTVPGGVALVPRSSGFPLSAPLAAAITPRITVPEA
jgi:predicted molibdopterin-dependent oxidoreductase YjgC